MSTEHPATAEHFNDCIECHRAKYATPGMTAGEFAPLLPEHLRHEYWITKLTQYFEAQEEIDEQHRRHEYMKGKPGG